jgi:GNAT superfamily N-acetyltransferase
MKIRNMTEDDLDAIMHLEEESWPEDVRGSRENFSRRIRTFPEGVIGVLYGTDLAGLTTSMIVPVDDPSTIGSWEEITADGTIQNHDTSGNCLYVVSLGASPRYSGKGVGSALLNAQIELGKRMKLSYLVLGSRVPGFHTFDGTITEYLSKQTPEGFSIDPLVRFYQRGGLSVVAVKSDYMEHDAESRNYGVVMAISLD